MDIHLVVKYTVHHNKAVLTKSLNCELIIIIIIMVIFKCYFSGELIALS